MSQDSPELKYLKQLQSEEKQRASAYIEGVSGSLDEQAKQAVTDLFADISSRIRVVEEYLVKQQGDAQEPGFEPVSSNLDTWPMPENKSAKIAIGEQEFYDVLSELNYNAQGLPYRFIFSEANLETSFNIDRSNKTTLAIDIEFSSSDDILKQIEIQIDGVQLKHRVVDINGHLRLLSHVPKRRTGGHTHLRIIAPKLIDGHKLALADIHCVPRLSVADFIKQKLLA